MKKKIGIKDLEYSSILANTSCEWGLYGATIDLVLALAIDALCDVVPFITGRFILNAIVSFLKSCSWIKTPCSYLDSFVQLRLLLYFAHLLRLLLQ